MPAITLSEEWREVPGYEDRYEVSNLGQVRSLLRGRVLLMAQRINGKNKYPYIGLRKDGHTTHFTVHSLVAMAFIGPRPEGLEVCHLDGDRSNPRADNLIYGTRSLNQRHRDGHGTGQRGEANQMAVLNEEKVRAIRVLHAGGFGYRRIARMTGWGSGPTIQAVCNRRSWSHVE